MRNGFRCRLRREELELSQATVAEAVFCRVRVELLQSNKGDDLTLLPPLVEVEGAWANRGPKEAAEETGAEAALPEEAVGETGLPHE